MKYRIEIDCDNDAFQEGLEYELSQILHDLCGRIYGRVHTDIEDAVTLYDTNGNRVGQAQLVEDE